MREDAPVRFNENILTSARGSRARRKKVKRVYLEKCRGHFFLNKSCLPRSWQWNISKPVLKSLIKHIFIWRDFDHILKRKLISAFMEFTILAWFFRIKTLDFPIKRWCTEYSSKKRKILKLFVWNLELGVPGADYVKSIKANLEVKAAYYSTVYNFNQMSVIDLNRVACACEMQIKRLY